MKNLVKLRTYKLIFFIVIFSSLFSCNSIEDIRFEKIDQFSQTYESSNGLTESYIVHGYFDSKITEKMIDSFACVQANEALTRYSGININFYKYSSNTNIEYLAKHPKQGETHALAYDYLWYCTFKKDGYVFKQNLKNYKNRKFYFKEPECWSK